MKSKILNWINQHPVEEMCFWIVLLLIVWSPLMDMLTARDDAANTWGFVLTFLFIYFAAKRVTYIYRNNK